MNLITVALSHCCCRTTLQCHRVVLNNRKRFLKQVSFQFPPKWDDRWSSLDSLRQRVPSPSCGHWKSAIADRCAACRRYQQLRCFALSPDLKYCSGCSFHVCVIGAWAVCGWMRCFLIMLFITCCVKMQAAAPLYCLASSQRIQTAVYLLRCVNTD